MIVKSFELSKIKLKNHKFYLFYGDNEGLKEEIIKNLFEKNYPNNTYKYEEKEVLDNTNDFFNSVLTKSFFDNKKLIIINRVTDRIRGVIEELMEKDPEEINIILNSKNLEKKSTLRKIFEKEKLIVCVPFYEDNNQTLNSIISLFFRNKKVPISQQLINVLIERSRGDRKNLQNELEKIESFSSNKKSINLQEIIKLTKNNRCIAALPARRLRLLDALGPIRRAVAGWSRFAIHTDRHCLANCHRPVRPFPV